MKKKLLVTFSLLWLSIAPLLAQQNSLWQPILAMSHYEQIEDSPTHLYLVANGSLFGINKQRPDQVHLYSHNDGLTDTRIAALYFEPQDEQLFIYYQSGKIDILSAKGVVSNSALFENYRLADKRAHKLVGMKEKVYIAGGFGISRIALQSASIEATYFLGNAVQDLAILGSNLYALLPDGSLYVGDETHNLQDPSQWQRLTLSHTTSKIAQLATHRGDLLIRHEDGTLYRLPQGGQPATKAYQDISLLLHEREVTLLKGNEKLVLLQEEQEELTLPIVRQLSEMAIGGHPNEIWMATPSNLYRYPHTTSMQDLAEWTPEYDAPHDNKYFFSTLHANRYYAVSGGRGSDRSHMTGGIKIWDGINPWIKITPEEVQHQVKPTFQDAVSIAVDPQDAKHFFVSTWGEGLLEFRDDTFVQQYTLGNSPLSSALPNSSAPDQFVRVGSLAFDSQGGLWMLQGSVEKNIVYLDKQRGWHQFSNAGSSQINSFGPSFVLPGDILWTTIYHNEDRAGGLLIVDINKTPDNTADDIIRYIPQFVDRTNKTIATHTFYCMALDNEGAMWLGSDKGPIIVTNPTQAHKISTPIATRPIGGSEPNLYYVLDNVRINAIAVDRLNNKWIGTANDGLYLLSADGTEIRAHYRAEESPLLSNNITTLSLNQETGILFIGTSEGLVTLQTGNFDSTAESLNAIHIYPNPLRPEDPDLVTLIGLSIGMELHITNAQGALVHSGLATASEYPLTVRNSNGERYASGIYTVLISDPKTGKAHHIRFAIL